MREEWIRTALLFGESGLEKLEKAHVAVFGIGGVGGYVAESLARSGIGKLDLFDNDMVSSSNINRQIIALQSTIGQYKVEVMKNRIQDINPEATVNTHICFYLPKNADQFDLQKYDYIVDCIDTVTAKLELIARAQSGQIPIISCMGTGNKLDPSKLQIVDIQKTTMCPLAKVMRHELRARGIEHVTVLNSTETPHPYAENAPEIQLENRRAIPASTAFVPPAAGLLIASKVVRDLLGIL